MPVWRFRSYDEAADALPATPPGEAALRTVLALAQLDEATRREVRISQRGVYKYASVAQGEADRERYALRRLRGES